VLAIAWELASLWGWGSESSVFSLESLLLSFGFDAFCCPLAQASSPRHNTEVPNARMEFVIWSSSSGPP
jgi:hypothetical protein